MLAVRPKRMTSKEQQKISQYQIGDNIVTTAGIVGIIKNITDSRVFVEVSDGVVLEMYKQALFHKVEENLLETHSESDASSDEKDPTKENED
jgi:preprotein translocase YajC subunit